MKNSSTKDVQIAAIGKAISSQNGEKIKNALTYLLDVIINAGMLSAGELGEMVERVMEPGVTPPLGHHDDEPPSGDLSGDLSDSDVVQAGHGKGELGNLIGKRIWRSNLSGALDIFRMKLRDVLYMSDDAYARSKYANDRKGTLAEYVADLIEFIEDSANKYKPEYRESDDESDPSYYHRPMAMACASTKASEEAVQAGRFIDSIERRAWTSRLDGSVDIFSSYFCDLVCFPDKLINSIYQVSNRGEAISKILSEFEDSLIKIIESFPLSLRYPDDNSIGSKLMQLASTDGLEQTTEILMEVGLQLAAKDPHELNRRPMEGMLFPIDKPSEATPAVGPGLPLFVPRSVAMALVNRVSGLPLDADPSLTKHANKHIVGVINAASIEGDEFRVQGSLYDWSQPELVAEISAQKSSLGMSMNAMAKGSTKEVDGRKVFWVESLQLMGANILKSNRATFTSTNLISASSSTDENEDIDTEKTFENDFNSPDFDSIVEQLDDLIDDEETYTEAEQIGDAILNLSEVDGTEEDILWSAEDSAEFSGSAGTESLEALALIDDIESNTEILASNNIMTDIERLSTQMEQFAENVNQTLGQVVQATGVLTDDYHRRLEEAQIQAARQEAADAAYAVDSIADLTIARLQAMGIGTGGGRAPEDNGNYAPARKTVAIAASSSQEETPNQQEQVLLLQLASIQGQLEALDAIPGTGEKMSGLIQQSQEIRAQISNQRR